MTTKKKGASARQEGGTHYIDMNIEPWDIVDTWPIEQQIGFYRGNAIKYLMRAVAKKNPISQEIAKAAHYIEKLREVVGK